MDSARRGLGGTSPAGTSPAGTSPEQDVVGPVHALFNIAGISSGAAPALKVVEVNFLGTRRLTEALLPVMEAGSAIACVSSLAAAGYSANIPTVQEFLATGARGSGGVPRDSFAAGRAWCEARPDELVSGGYGFAKQAIIVYTMMSGVALGARGIRINCIGPTVTDTPFLADTIKTYGEGFIDAFPKPLGRVSHWPGKAMRRVDLWMGLR